MRIKAAHIRQLADPVRGTASYLTLLMRLDEGYMGGLPGHIVDSLLAQCRKCDWVTTTRTFHQHVCMVPKTLFADLVPGDDDDDEEPEPEPLE
jgi:hypothetical protein